MTAIALLLSANMTLADPGAYISGQEVSAFEPPGVYYSTYPTQIDEPAYSNQLGLPEGWRTRQPSGPATFVPPPPLPTGASYLANALLLERMRARPGSGLAGLLKEIAVIVSYVKTMGPHDYKNDPNTGLTFEKFDPAGNYTFGVDVGAIGWDLSFARWGAGIYSIYTIAKSEWLLRGSFPGLLRPSRLFRYGGLFSQYHGDDPKSGQLYDAGYWYYKTGRYLTDVMLFSPVVDTKRRQDQFREKTEVEKIKFEEASKAKAKADADKEAKDRLEYESHHKGEPTWKPNHDACGAYDSGEAMVIWCTPL